MPRNNTVTWPVFLDDFKDLFPQNGQQADSVELVVNAIVFSHRMCGRKWEGVVVSDPTITNTFQQQVFAALMSSNYFRALVLYRGPAQETIQFLREALRVGRRIERITFQTFEMTVDQATGMFNALHASQRISWLHFILKEHNAELQHAFVVALSYFIRNSSSLETVRINGFARDNVVLREESFNLVCTALSASQSVFKVVFDGHLVDHDALASCSTSLARALARSGSIRKVRISPAELGNRMMLHFQEVDLVNSEQSRLSFHVIEESDEGTSLKIHDGCWWIDDALPNDIPLNLWPYVLSKADTCSHSHLDILLFLTKEKCAMWRHCVVQERNPGSKWKASRRYVITLVVVCLCWIFYKTLYYYHQVVPSTVGI